MTQKTVVTLEMVDSCRMRQLEQALEYAINRVDGLNYTIYSTPLVRDAELDRARALLPRARWQWFK